MGMDIGQFRVYIVRPVLEHLRLHSFAAENLLIGTALQESRLSYVRQLGAGPAIGIYQMEPATHDDIWRNYLAYHHGLAALVRTLELPGWYGGEAIEMAGNMYYATAMCRIHYRRVSAPLPAADDVHGLARYWKRHYNTALGKGTAEEFIQNYTRAA